MIKRIKFILSLVSMLAFYLGGHLLLFFLTIYFFEVQGWGQLILLLILGCLAVSFIIAIILTRLSDFILVRIYYFLSAFWLGLMIYLFIGFISAWLLNKLLGIFDLDLRLWLGALAGLAALAVSLYASWNANHPQVKNISVKLKNLPSSWRGQRVMQLSDLHLGDINGLSFVTKIVQQVNRLQPQAIFITGDLFDGTDGAAGKFIPILEQLTAEQGIYFITGNHETYIGAQKIIDLLKPTKIKVLQNEFINLGGLQILGFNYPDTRYQPMEAVNWPLQNFDTSLSTILLYHEPVAMDQVFSVLKGEQPLSFWKPKTDFSWQKNNGIHLQLSGHTHQGQFFPFNLITRKVYRGYDYGLFTEDDFNLYVTNGAGTWGPPFRLGRPPEIVSIVLQ